MYNFLKLIIVSNHFIDSRLTLVKTIYIIRDSLNTMNAITSVVIIIIIIITNSINIRHLAD